MPPSTTASTAPTITGSSSIIRISTMGSGGSAPDRFPWESLPGFGSYLIENRINVQYQFYF